MTDKQTVSQHLDNLPKVLARAVDEYSVMGASQRAKLMSLIEEKKPKKILEAGVLAGSRTVELANYILINDTQAEIIAVDSTVKYYADASKQTGFLVKDMLDLTDMDSGRIRLFIGDTVNDVLPTIDSTIDFLILDSYGMAPGEISNLVACLPYLSEECTIVFPRTDSFAVISGLTHAIETLGLDEPAVEELLESNRFFISQALDLRRGKALTAAKLKHRIDDLAFTKKKLASAQEGLNFYRSQAEKAKEGLDFYRSQAEKAKAGLDFYKELLQKKDEGVTFYRKQLENREDKIRFYKQSSEAKNRECERIRAQMDSQEKQLADIENSLSWRIASKIGSLLGSSHHRQP